MSEPAAVAHPFLHVEADRIEQPLTGRSLRPGDEDYEALRRVACEGAAADALPAAVRDRLLAADWLAPAGRDDSRRFRLRFVSLEAHSLCNDRCWFCPVSEAPRPAHWMADALFERIVGQVGAHRQTIEAVFLNNYNEPTLDKRFVSQVAALRAAGLPVAVLTNGSGLTPDRVEAIVELGGLRYLSVNLSTLDAEAYRRTRGTKHLPAVLRNLEHARTRPVAARMEIVVLGEDDEAHDRAFAEISARFAGSRFAVQRHAVMDRAGYFGFGRRTLEPHRRLRGCENVGSRPLQHLHVTAHGKCVFCCEDYEERHLVGDLRVQSLDEVLAGPQLARLRRLAYGVEEADESFLCRRCVFARTG